MKLASLKGGRDGKLVVVSRDLSRASLVTDIAPTLQAALDDWATIAPKLHQAAADLEAGKRDSFAFDEAACASPLPRAYQWADGSAYVNHAELVRKARGAEMPQSFWTDPLMYQGGSDAFLGPRDERPRARRMSDKLREIEDHVHAGVGAAEELAVPVAQQRQVQLVVPPGIAQLVRRDRDGGEGA